MIRSELCIGNFYDGPEFWFSNFMGYDDWIQRKIWILLYPEACYVTQEKQCVGTGNTANIQYNYILLTAEINDLNIRHLNDTIFHLFYHICWY